MPSKIYITLGRRYGKSLSSELIELLENNKITFKTPNKTIDEINNMRSKGWKINANRY